MLLTMLKTKLHRLTVTGAFLDYDGSIGIPRDLMDEAGLLEFEQVDVLNVNNGERFTTYVIELEAGCGRIEINGPAARRAQAGDRVIVCAYARFEAAEAKKHSPRVLLMNADNTVKTQLAA